jgi:hypothetical protein
MFVRHLYTDEWQGGVDVGSGIVDPSWEAIQAAILALDSTSKTLVTIADREWSDYFLLVVGAWDGRVLVNSTKNSQIFFSLTDATRQEKMRTLLIAGQHEEYEEYKLVPIECAIEAAQHFYETGERKSTLNWRRDE